VNKGPKEKKIRRLTFSLPPENEREILPDAGEVWKEDLSRSDILRKEEFLHLARRRGRICRSEKLTTTAMS
jgi:hypothetical protein